MATRINHMPPLPAATVTGPAAAPPDWHRLAPHAARSLSAFTAQRLAVRMSVVRPVRLHEHQGAAIRGALFGALRGRFCVRQELPSCQPCTLHAICPISTLLATVDDASRRGADVPRPFSLQPPLGGRTLHESGQSYDFGLTLFGRGLEHLPYVVLGLQDLGSMDFGLRGAQGPGQLRLERILAMNPLTGAHDAVYGAHRPAAQQDRTAGAPGAPGSDVAEGTPGGVVRVPRVPVTQDHVLARAARWLGHDHVTLRLLTPLRLASEPVRQITFGFFFRRLVDRLETLALHYGGTPHGGASPLGADGAATLTALAQPVRVLEDATRWREVQSYSARQGRRTPLGGLVGDITFGAPPDLLAPLLPWLVWGEIAHAGKDATRGNGWYRLEDPEPPAPVLPQTQPST